MTALAGAAAETQDIWVSGRWRPPSWSSSALFVAPLAYFLVISFWSVRARIMRPDFTLKNYVATLTDYGGHAGQHHPARARDRALDDAPRLRLRLCHPLPRRALRQRAAVPDADHALRRLSGQDLRLEEHPGPRRHPQPGADRSRPHRRAALGACIYSANGIVITLTYFLLPFAVLPIYGNMRAIRDVTLEAARDLGAGAVATLRNDRRCRNASAASSSPSCSRS